MADMNALLSYYGTTLNALLPYLKIVGLMFVLMFFVMTLKYQGAALVSMVNKARGLKKIGIVYKDNVIGVKWVNFKKDFEIFDVADKEKLYALSNKGRYVDWVGEPITFFNQDTTEEIKFVPRQRFVYVDVETDKPLLDEKGMFVSKLNWLQVASKKYKKVVDDNMVRVESLVRQGLVDETFGVTVKMPCLIGDEQNGIDGALTADVINRHMEIEMINFLKKHWQTIVIVGMVILLCCVGSVVFSAQANGKIEAVQKTVSYIAANFNTSNAVVVN